MVVGMKVNSHQFGAHTDWIGMGPGCLYSTACLLHVAKKPGKGTNIELLWCREAYENS